MITSVVEAGSAARQGCDRSTGPTFQAMVSLRGSDGQVHAVPWAQLHIEHLTCALPFRRWRSRKGQHHLPGNYWATTTGHHVPFESQLELARLLLADFDPLTVDIRAQPFRLTAKVDGRVRSHVPDFLLVSVSHAVTVVNVKPASRLADSRVAQRLAWPGVLFAEHGWEHEIWTGCPATVLANVRFLAGYRRDLVVSDAVARTAAEAVRDGEQLAGAEQRLTHDGGRLSARPALLAALWRGMLSTDLSKPLSGDSVLRRAC